MMLALEVTRACNYHCKYCGVSAGEPLNKELSTQEIFDLLEKTKPKYFCITGGEPLLRKDIFKIIDRGKKYGFVCLKTNGSLLSKKVAKRLNADEIDISVDALPGKHGDLRNKKNFQDVLKALDALESVGKLKRVRICITVSRENLDEIDRIIRYFSPRIRKYGIGKLAPIGRATKDKKPSRKEAAIVYLKLLPLMLTNNIIVYSEFGGIFKIVVSGLNVLADGSIIPCCLVRKPIGNIRTSKKLKMFPMLCPIFFSGCAECKQICSK